MRKFEKGDLVTVVPGPTAQYYRVVDTTQNDTIGLTYRRNDGYITRTTYVPEGVVKPVAGLPWGHKLVEVTPFYVYLEDAGGETKSITNGATVILEALNQIIEEGLGKRGVFYKDSMGRIDQIIVGRNFSVDGFYGGPKNQALNVVREKYGHRDYDGGR